MTALALVSAQTAMTAMRSWLTKTTPPKMAQNVSVSIVQSEVLNGQQVMQIIYVTGFTFEPNASGAT